MQDKGFWFLTVVFTACAVLIVAHAVFQAEVLIPLCQAIGQTWIDGNCIMIGANGPEVIDLEKMIEIVTLAFWGQ